MSSSRLTTARKRPAIQTIRRRSTSPGERWVSQLTSGTTSSSRRIFIDEAPRQGRSASLRDGANASLDPAPRRRRTWQGAERRPTPNAPGCLRFRSGLQSASVPTHPSRSRRDKSVCAGQLGCVVPRATPYKCPLQPHRYRTTDTALRTERNGPDQHLCRSGAIVVPRDSSLSHGIRLGRVAVGLVDQQVQDHPNVGRNVRPLDVVPQRRRLRRVTELCRRYTGSQVS